MRSPLSTAAGTYVWLTPCPTSTMTSQITWTRFEYHQDRAISYTVRDALGNCLSPTDLDGTDLYGSGRTPASKMLVAPCDGTTLQKWNAPPQVSSTPLHDFGENVGG